MMENTHAEMPDPALTYDGRVGELYRIFLVNLLLTIVTLGIWRFWAVTRIRRYVWSRTSCGGERFEYDGTGGQLFAGFLLAMLVLAGLAAAAAGASWLLLPVHPGLAFVPALLFELVFVTLALGAPFSAQRYRLNHTIWRGIRGGMQGSMLAYGLRSLLYYAIAAVTLFQLWPWASVRLLERRINASAFGSIGFDAQCRPGKVYGRFLAACAGLLVLGFVVLGGMAALLWPSMSQVHNPAAAQAVTQKMVYILLPANLVLAVGGMLILAGYKAAVFRHVTGSTTLGGLHFRSNVSRDDVVKLAVGNTLILAATLGLGLPVVIQRNARFFATYLLADGSPDVGAMRQGEQRPSRFGEGMFQLLDAGTGVI